MRGNRERRPFASLALCICGCLAGLLLLEILTRAVGPHAMVIPPPRGARAFWVYDPVKGWFHKPGLTGLVRLGPPDDKGPAQGYVRINSLGLRGPEPAPRSQSTARVLVIGDSYVFGGGVDEEHLFTTLLGERLGAEAINAGVYGYSTDQELLLLRELLPRLKPDAVVLVVCDNDIDGNELDFTYYRYYKPYFELARSALVLRNNPVPRLSRVQDAKLWLATHSNLWNVVRTRRTEARWLQGLLDWCEVEVPRAPRKPLRKTVALVTQIQTETQRTGAHFLAVNAAQVTERRDLIQAVGLELQRRGVNWVDVYNRLQRARRTNPADDWDFSDRHWNLRSHAAMAEIVAREIERQQLLPAARKPLVAVGTQRQP